MEQGEIVKKRRSDYYWQEKDIKSDMCEGGFYLIFYNFKFVIFDINYKIKFLVKTILDSHDKILRSPGIGT